MLKTIEFEVEGPLQAWGVPSGRSETKPTAVQPTKRGVAGLVGCAMGIKRNDPELEKLQSEISLNIIVNRPGEYLTDYQTVNPTPERKITKADGKKQDTTVILHKSYLMDASFSVRVTCQEDLAKRIYEALENPVWPVYLGRKCCTPSKPILPKYVETEDDICSI